MTTGPEIERREWTEPVVCRGCGKEVRLYFNGGELDTKRCCGYTYALEHGEIYLVVYAPREK